MSSDDDIRPEAVKVIFRKWPNGGVIALFPEIPGGTTTEFRCSSEFCQSYEHIGQHGDAWVGIVGVTEPASLDEAADLWKELVRIGYVPTVVKRFSSKMRAERQKEIDRWKS